MFEGTVLVSLFYVRWNKLFFVASYLVYIVWAFSPLLQGCLIEGFIVILTRFNVCCVEFSKIMIFASYILHCIFHIAYLTSSISHHMFQLVSLS